MANIGYDDVADPNSPLAKAVNKALGDQYDDSLYDESPVEPTKLEYSGIVPTKASEIIEVYKELTPKKQTTFKAEPFLLGIAVGTVGLAIVVIIIILGV